MTYRANLQLAALAVALATTVGCKSDASMSDGGGTDGGTGTSADDGSGSASGSGSADESTGGMPGFDDRATQVVIDPAGGFWDLPLPSDLRLEDDGTWDLDKWPGGSNNLISMWLDTADRRVVGGWGVSSGVLIRTTGPIDETTLPADGAPTMDPSSPVFLIDVDPASSHRGELLPIRPRFTAEAPPYAAANTLMALPVFGFTRRASTRYALVLTEALLDKDGMPIGRSEPFHDAWVGAPGADGDMAADLADVRDTLDQVGIDTTTVVGATVFTTIDPTEDLLHLAAWSESLPDPELSEPWVVAEDYDDYQVLNSHYTVPVYQTGMRPYANPGEGLIIYGDDGNPVIQETQQVRLALTIPKVPQPANGFPLMVYLHGSGGNWYQAIDRGPVPEVEGADGADATPGTGPAALMATRGVATLGFDFPLHGDRNDPPDTTGLAFYNLFGNVDATIDNFNVAMVELLLLSRLANSMTVDATIAATLDAGGDPNDTIRFDPERLTAMGQSMGTTLGVRWATVDPRVKGVLWSGAGGILVEIATAGLEPVELRMLISTLTMIPYDQLDDTHPLLHAFQNLWDLADPIAVANHLATEPFDGVPTKDVMMFAGERDGYFSPVSQTAMAIGLGTPLAGDPVEDVLPAGLDLSGAGTVDYPVNGNVNGKTMAVVQYSAPYDLGHYVAFNQDPPRHQYSCFLASVGSPGGAILPAPGALGDPCP